MVKAGKVNDYLARTLIVKILIVIKKLQRQMFD